MFNHHKLHQFVILTLIFMTGIVATQAQQLADNAIHVRVPDSVAENQVLPMDIIANITTPSYGFSFEVEYNHTMLQPRMTENIIARLGDLFPEAQVIVNQSKQLTDTLSVIEIAYTQVAPKSAITGEGVLTSVHFDILQVGDTQVRVQDPKLAEIVDGIAQYIPVQLSDPTVYIDIEGIVVLPPPPPPGPSIVLIAAFSLITIALAGFIFLFYLSRRNRRNRSVAYGL